MLEARELTCIRNGRRLFSGLSFMLEGGEILQVDGANGSGKTSLLRIMCGLALPDEGEIHWCGAPINRVRPEFLAGIAYIAHAHGIKEELTARENLRIARALGSGGADVGAEQALERVGLGGFEDVRARTLSAGQKRKVALARLLVSKACLWVLDEPFTGLDKAARGITEAMLATHSSQGGMTLLTTHHSANIDCARIRHIHLGE